MRRRSDWRIAAATSITSVTDNGTARTDGSQLAAHETKEINILRFIVLILLLSIATLASVGVYLYTANFEQDMFQADVSSNALRIIDSFHLKLEQTLGSINFMADSITLHALSSKQKFPFVTVPHFEVLGSDLRIQADAVIVHFMPLVTQEKRGEWEEYALENRNHIDDAFEEDARLRTNQDKQFGYGDGEIDRMLQQSYNVTVLDDGTRYHPRIWSNRAVTARGDDPEGLGPYLPLWQRSPINEDRQRSLNLNFANAAAFKGVLPALQQNEEAIMSRAVIPLPEFRDSFAQNLAISQYRHDRELYFNDPMTFLAYPVFDSFDEDRQIAGVIAMNVYWRLFFTEILPPTARGYVCVLENSFNQTLAYRIDGPDVTYLGEGDHHDNQYNHFEEGAGINDYVVKNAGPHTRSYTTVPLNKEFGQYQLRIYPTSETEEAFLTNKPWVYAIVVLSVFLLTAILLFALDRVVARRQLIVMNRVVKTAEDAAAFEHDLNAFLAHEVRNPLAAAISANGFVTTSIDEIPNEKDHRLSEELVSSLRGDVKIVGASLHFIDEFLRSILDIHASDANKLAVNLAPADLLKDVLEPVCGILHQRDSSVNVVVECPENLIVLTDCLRLKQVMMNLGRNSIKFTTRGFVRFRAAVVDDLVELYVDDSGAGIPVEKQGAMFAKFQTSLDLLNQGTGIGLSLCEKLTHLLHGKISLDNTYDSGVPGSPGASFVVKLKTPPLQTESILDSARHEYNSSKAAFMAPIVTPENTLSLLAENLSILFVDDDNVLRKLFVRAAKKVAPTWSISEAASGESALVLVETGRFDVIFMDQYMASTQKQLLGTETTRAMRLKGVDCTICGLSANNIEDSFVSAGADCFLLKPFPCARGDLERELVRITHARPVQLDDLEDGDGGRTAP